MRWTAAVDKTHEPYFLLHSSITGRILKVFFEVYHELGHGFREFVYLEAMRIALRAEGLELAKGVAWPVWFRGARIAMFKPDIVVTNGPVLIELKARSTIESQDIAQALNYLRASDIEVALILNFGKRPEYLRRVFENRNKPRATASHPPNNGVDPSA